jgi:Methyltransferase domain
MTDQAGEPDPWVMQYEFTSKRLNRLAAALGAQTYLEIGVHTGGTFARVQVPERTAVDPAFPFPVADHEDDVTIFAEVTSDEFFAGLPTTRTYDLIFIDGLHTFEQAYRDLCNAIVHSHRATAILVDDTVPSDVYSSLRDPEQAFAFRAAAGPDGGVAWHGDTFKVVFAVHDFHLALDYRTIVGSGNPQTLVWRSNAGRRQPLLDSLEKISRLTYFDMVNHSQVLRECDEETALRECLDAIGPADGQIPPA